MKKIPHDKRISGIFSLQLLRKSPVFMEARHLRHRSPVQSSSYRTYFRN